MNVGKNVGKKVEKRCMLVVKQLDKTSNIAFGEQITNTIYS